MKILLVEQPFGAGFAGFAGEFGLYAPIVRVVREFPTLRAIASALEREPFDCLLLAPTLADGTSFHEVLEAVAARQKDCSVVLVAEREQLHTDFVQSAALSGAVALLPVPCAWTEVAPLLKTLAEAHGYNPDHYARPPVFASELQPLARKHYGAIPQRREVQTTEVQTTEVQTAEVQTAEVQTAEVQTAEVQTTEVQSTRLQPTRLRSDVTLPFVWDGKKIERVEVARICYLEADKHTVSCITSDGQRLHGRKPLQYYAALLEPSGFVLCHRSYVISLQNLWRLDKDFGEFRLPDDETIKRRVPIAKGKYALVVEAWGAWHGWEK